MKLTDEAAAVARILDASVKGLARDGHLQAAGLCATGALAVSRLLERVLELEAELAKAREAIPAPPDPEE